MNYNMIHLQYQIKQMTNMERRTEEQFEEAINGGKNYKQKILTWIPIISEMKVMRKMRCNISRH